MCNGGGPSGHSGLAGQSSADRGWATRAISSAPTGTRPDSVPGHSPEENSTHEPPALLADELPRGAAAMAWQTVPDDQQLAGNMAQQMGEELDEVPPRHPRHRRQHLPIDVIL